LRDEDEETPNSGQSTGNPADPNTSGQSGVSHHNTDPDPGEDTNNASSTTANSSGARKPR